MEVKNLNSFRSVERAIAYEVARQAKLLDAGEKVSQETRGWDETKQSTFSQRKKESSHDYRYFPDPDLPKLALSEIQEFSKEALTNELPELPSARRARYTALGLKLDDAEMFTRMPQFGTFFDTFLGVATKGTELLGANYIVSDIAGNIEKGEMDPSWLSVAANATRFAKLMDLSAKGTLSSRGVKDTLALMSQDGGDPETIAKNAGLIQQSDTGLIDTIVQKIIAANPTVVADYKAGKEAALQFLVGQGMKESKGSANPAVLRERIVAGLGK